MKTDLTITTTSATDNKKVTNKISYVNPNLTNNQAIELAQAISSLTTDSYFKTTRTDTTDCDATRPRPMEFCRYRKNNNWYDVPTDGAISMTTAEITAKSLSIMVKTVNDGIAMQILDFTDTNTEKPCNVNQIQFGGAIGDPALKDRWRALINNGAFSADQTDIPACTITFKIKFDQTYQYDEWEKTITFTITEAGGE